MRVPLRLACAAVTFAACCSVTAPALADPPAYKVIQPATNSNQKTWTSGDRFALMGVLMFGSAMLVPGTIFLLSGPAEDPAEETRRLRTGWGLFIAGNVWFGALLPLVIYSANQPKDPGQSVPNLMMFAPNIGPGHLGLSALGTF